MRRLRMVPGEAGNFVWYGKLACGLPSKNALRLQPGPFLSPLYLPGVEAAHIAKCPSR